MTSRRPPFYKLFLLILSAEVIFLMPFVIPRVFRPTYLKVFELSNYELGTCFSAYGFVALISYLFGGFVADRFSANKLIAISLILTSFGGLFLARFPRYETILIIYAYWGFTTIFFFWAAMIKATRIWGGQKGQGLAYSLLDGGRGLLAAILGTLGIWLFASLFPDEITGTIMESRTAFQPILHLASLIVAVTGVIVLWGLKQDDDTSKTNTAEWSKLKPLLSSRAIWLIMSIVCSAYVGYKITGNFSLYANQVMQFNEVESAQVGAFVVYMRPVVSLILAIISVRFTSITLIRWGFLFMLSGAILFSLGWITAGQTFVFLLILIICGIGIYSTRALYFALVQNSGFPLEYTGTVVGLVSVIGFTPEIFIGPWTGTLLDNNPGLLGHQFTFTVLLGFAFMGFLASLFFRISPTEK